MGELGKMQWAAAAQLQGCSYWDFHEHHLQGMGRQQGTAAALWGCLCRAPLPTRPIWGQGTLLHLWLFVLHGLRVCKAFRNAAAGEPSLSALPHAAPDVPKCSSPSQQHAEHCVPVQQPVWHHRRQDLNQTLRNQLSGVPKLLCSRRHLEPETSNCSLETEVQRGEVWGHCSARSPNGKGQILSRSEW